MEALFLIQKKTGGWKHFSILRFWSLDLCEKVKDPFKAVETPLFLCFDSYNNLMGYERTCFVEPGNQK